MSGAIMFDISQRIHELMKLHNVRTKTDFAKKAAISPSTLASLLSGDNSPMLYTIERICENLDMSLVDFFSSGDQSGDQHTLELARNFRKIPVEAQILIQSIIELYMNEMKNKNSSVEITYTIRNKAKDLS